jgi:hypothetical protein
MRCALSIEMNQALASFVMLLSLVLTTKVSRAETVLRDADIEQAAIDAANLPSRVWVIFQPTSLWRGG